MVFHCVADARYQTFHELAESTSLALQSRKKGERADASKLCFVRTERHKALSLTSRLDGEPEGMTIGWRHEAADGRLQLLGLVDTGGVEDVNGARYQ